MKRLITLLAAAVILFTSCNSKKTDAQFIENADGTVFYDYTIRKDLKCPDGVALTADDLIFSFYVYSDPTYDGSASIFSLPILGMEEYRSGMDSLFNLL